jgi:hypothetical protein
MSPLARQINAWVAWAWVAAIAIQVTLAGLAIPQLGGNGNFGTHQGFGYAMTLFALALVAAAAVAKAGRARILQALGILGLYAIQTILPNLDPGLSFAAALHPLNAAILFAVSVWYARQAWRERAIATA